MTRQETDAAWYVLRVTYQRELPTKEYLDNLNIENFVPFQRAVLQGPGSGRT